LGRAHERLKLKHRELKVSDNRERLSSSEFDSGKKTAALCYTDAHSQLHGKITLENRGDRKIFRPTFPFNDEKFASRINRQA
jgi:hypothetical protein